MINQPLKCSIEGDELVIRIGVGTIAFCCKEKNGGPLENNLTVIDKHQFAKDVAHELEGREEENGDTPFRLLLDEAFKEAANMGSLGLRYPKKRK